MLIHLVKAVTLPLRAGQRTDNARACHVFLHFAHHAVLRALHTGKKRHATPGNLHHREGQKGQRGGHHQGQHRLQYCCNDQSAHEQDGGTHAETLHLVNHLVHIVGIAGQAGDKRRFGQLVPLGSGETLCLVKQITAQLACDFPAHTGGEFVGRHVAKPCQQRA